MQLIALLLIFLTQYSQYTFAADNDIKTLSITSTDVRRVKIVFDKEWPTRMEILLIPKKAREISAFTKDNIGRKVRLIIEGVIVSEPRIQGQVSSLDIVPINTDEAIRLAKSLTGHEEPDK